MPASSTPEPPKSVCLIRLSALGDVCNTVPLIRALQGAWPTTKFTWIVGKVEYRLVQDLPGVEFIVFDKRGRFGGYPAARRALKGRHFDLLVLAQVSQRSTFLSSLVRADRRLGFDRPRSRPGHGLAISERIEAVPFQHQVEAFLEFARYLGAPTQGVDRSLPVPEAARDWARDQQPERGRAVLISPGSSHEGRNWTPEGYATVADWIIEHTARPVILLGSPAASEVELGLQIEARMRGKPVNLIGQDTLKQSLAMFERAACLIAPDTGPAHFADAMGLPVVGLYAATWSRRSGPYSSLAHTVDQYRQAALRFKGCEPEELRWGKRLEEPGVMSLITPGQVIEKLKPLLGVD